MTQAEIEHRFVVVESGSHISQPTQNIDEWVKKRRKKNWEHKETTSKMEANQKHLLCGGGWAMGG